MSLNTIFILSFWFAAPFWFLMIFLPNWSWTRKIIRSPWIIAPAALVYMIMLVATFGDASFDFANFDLAMLASAFGTESVALVGWLHFIALDLLAGRWAYLDSHERTISPFIMALVLFAILMLAPLGILIYLVVRQVSMSRATQSA